MAVFASLLSAFTILWSSSVSNVVARGGEVGAGGCLLRCRCGYRCFCCCHVSFSLSFRSLCFFLLFPTSKVSHQCFLPLSHCCIMFPFFVCFRFLSFPRQHENWYPAYENWYPTAEYRLISSFVSSPSCPYPFLSRLLLRRAPTAREVVLVAFVGSVDVLRKNERLSVDKARG